MNKFTFAIFIFLSLLILLSLDSRLSLTGDNALYIILARSIASGRGYRNLSHPTEPQHFNYPPVLPLLLSPIISISRSNLWAMKIEIALLGIASLIAIYLLFRELTNPPVALLITLLSGTSTLFLIYTNRIMSEIPYLLFSALALFSLLKAVREKKRAIYLLLAIIFVTISYFTRSIGIMLFLAPLPVIWQARYKFAKAKILSILLVVFLLPFALWTMKLIQRGRGKKPAAKRGSALISLLLLFNLIWAGKNIYEVRRGRELPPGWKDYKASALWLKENAPQDVVIACRKPYLMHIFCDRKTVRIPFTQDANQMLKVLSGLGSPLARLPARQAKPVSHIIYDDLGLGTEKWLEPFYERYYHLLSLVHQKGRTKVWEFRSNIEEES